MVFVLLASPESSGSLSEWVYVQWSSFKICHEFVVWWCSTCQKKTTWIACQWRVYHILILFIDWISPNLNASDKFLPKMITGRDARSAIENLAALSNISSKKGRRNVSVLFDKPKDQKVSKCSMIIFETVTDICKSGKRLRWLPATRSQDSDVWTLLWRPVVLG